MLFGLAVLLAVACLWVTPFPPLVDLPQHAGQVAALQEILRGNAEFTATFRLNWFAPYTATYLLIYALAGFMPLTLAVKVIVSIAVAAIPLLTGQLLTALGSYRGWQWLAIPAGFGVAFHWGFLPFMLAAPLVLLLLLLTIRFAVAPTVGRGVLIALLTALLFFFHVIALGFAGLLCIGYIAVLNYRQPQRMLLLWLPYTAGLPLLAYWYLSTLTGESYVQGAAVVYGPLFERLLNLLAQPAGLGGYVMNPSAALTLGLLAYPPLTGARLSKRPERLVLPVLGVLVMLLMPSKAFGSILLFERLTLFLLPLWVLAWDYPERHRPVWQPAIVIVIVVLGLANVGRFVLFGNEMRNLSVVLDTMEERQTLMYFPVVPVTAGFAQPVHFHSGVWYQAQQRGITDFNFAFFFPALVRFREGAHSWVPNDSVVWQPLQFDWERSNGDFYDYFLVRSPMDMRGELFKSDTSKVELLTNEGWWWLYKKAADQPRLP